MAFSLLFREGGQTSGARAGGLPVDLLHRAECAACPLNHAPGLRHPKMGADGRPDADIFFLAEAPGEEEDRRGHVLVGPAGRVLRMRVPERFLPRIRWGNIIRCRPPKNRDPTDTERECCRPEVERQIVASRPVAVVGFGNHPLVWAIGQSGINKWRARRVPVRIAGHPCWFFPVLHPSAIGRGRRFEPRDAGEYGSDDEFAFALDVRRALEAVEAGLPEPVIHDREFAERGVTWVTGRGGWDDYEALRAHLRRAAAAPASGLDLETTGRRPYQEGARILTAAVATEEASLAFPLDHREAAWSAEQREAVGELFSWYLREARGIKTVFCLAFEMEWIAQKVDPALLRAGRWDCSMVQAHIIDHRNRMGRPDALSLELLCLQYFGINIKALSSLDKDRLDEEPLDQVLRYNGIDSRYHLLLHHAQEERLRAEGLWEVYDDRVRHVPTVILTQVQGQPVDREVVRALDEEYRERLQESAAEVAAQPLAARYQARYGRPFRPSANDDVRKLLALAGLHADSAEAEVVARLRDPMREPLLAWKKVAKAHGTYVKPFVVGVWPDGLAHSQLSLTSVDTYRTSCDGPNNQNYPRRNAEYKRVRAQISARAWQQHLRDTGHPDAQYEHLIVAFDYGQIQARNVAMESGDQELIQAFWNEYDIHSHWRDRLAELHPQWVVEGVGALARDKTLAKSYRDKSKNGFVFASLFGSAGKSVAANLGVPEKIGIRLQEEFWDRFRGVHAWHGRKREEYKELGYVTGHSGLRRAAPVAYNEIINTPIQQDEVTIVLDAMTRCSEAGLQAMLEIHDDLTFCWPRHRVDEYAEMAIDIMLNPSYEWAKMVPTVVEMSVGPDWASLSGAGTFSSARWR